MENSGTAKWHYYMNKKLNLIAPAMLLTTFTMASFLHCLNWPLPLCLYGPEASPVALEGGKWPTKHRARNSSIPSLLSSLPASYMSQQGLWSAAEQPQSHFLGYATKLIHLNSASLQTPKEDLTCSIELQCCWHPLVCLKPKRVSYNKHYSYHC